MNAEEITRRVRNIREDRERGATQLARIAVELLADMAADREIPNEDFARFFPRVVRELAGARPSMVSLLNAVGTVAGAWPGVEGASRSGAARELVARAAEQWMRGQEAAAGRIADHSARLLSGTIATISYSSTVLRALETAWARGSIQRLLVAEARPLLEGRRMATLLASSGIPTTLITDAQVGLLVAEASMVVVGADTLLSNGSLVNKSGTLLLALAARHYRLPFYVLAETHKIAPPWHGPDSLELEEKDPEEVLPEPIAGVAVRNVYFDLTPGRYISGYITEEGLLGRQGVTILSRQSPAMLLREASQERGSGQTSRPLPLQ